MDKFLINKNKHNIDVVNGIYSCYLHTITHNNKDSISDIDMLIATASSTDLATELIDLKNQYVARLKTLKEMHYSCKEFAMYI